jgi:Tfp pilus assembly protein PilN
LRALITAHLMGDALEQMAITLAQAIDRITETGRGIMVLPALNRELRDNLAELTRLAANDDDPLADELSAPVRDGPQS